MIALRRIAIRLFGVLGTTVFASSLLANGWAERIIGKNDLLQVPSSLSHDPRIQAIGKLQIGCTATHIGNGIAISAGHCFARGNFDGKREHLTCSDIKHTIRWGVTYGSEGYLSSHCTEVIALELNSERDYAIFRVSPVPATAMPVNLEPFKLNDDISIFSHPRMRPLEWSQWCKVEGFVERSLGNQFFYSCDTEGGSSGASVLDKDYRVIGIHNYYNGILGRNGATRLAATPLAEILAADKARGFPSVKDIAKPFINTLVPMIAFVK